MNRKDHIHYQVLPILHDLDILGDTLVLGIPLADLHLSSYMPRQLIVRLIIDKKTKLFSY